MRTVLSILLLSLVHNIASAQFAAKTVISLGGGNIAEQVEPADLDGDGKIDILTKGMFGNYIYWLQNQGNGTFVNTNRTLPGSNWGNLVYLKAFDCDKDGDKDVVGAFLHDYDGKVILWKNDGNGNFSAAIPLTGTLSQVSSIETADMDGDGDIDLVLSTPYETAKWIENKLPTNTWEIHELSYTLNPHYIQILDFDNNGTLDVLSLGESSLKLNGVDVLPYPPGVWFSNARFIKAIDVDRDLDYDIVAAEQGYSDGILWFENNNNQFTKHVFAGSAGIDYRALTAFDYDNDGDEDVFAGCWLECNLTLFENTGAGTFVQKNILGGNGINKNELKHADIDADGKTDLVRNDAGFHTVLWHKNNVTAFTGISSDFVYTGTCERSDITFTHTARGKDIVSWEWDFGDGSPKTTTPRTTHTFGTAGDYSVKLTVKNGNGQSNSVTKTVTIRPRPAKDDDKIFTFCKQGYDGDVTVTLPGGFDYTWSNNLDGTGVFNNTSSFKFSYPAEVYVWKTNSYGCTGEVPQKITVKQYEYPRPPETKGAVSFSGAADLVLQATAKPGEVVQWITLESDEPYYTGNTFSEKVTQTTTRYVRAVNNGGCASIRTPVTASIYDKPLPAAPEFTWADPTTSDTPTEGTTMMKDNNGNYIAVGYYGAGNFKSGSFTLPIVPGIGPYNHYLWRFNKDDVTLQANNILQSEYGWYDGRFAVDSDLNIYLTVGTQNSMRIGGTVVTPPGMNQSYSVLAKLNSDGQYVWHKFIYDTPMVGVSANNLITVSNSITSAYSKTDGSVSWATSSPISAWDVVVDPAGNTFITGYSQGSVNNAVVQKISPTGESLWQKEIVTPNTFSGGKGIAVDSDGNVIITGTYWPISNLAGNTNVSVFGTVAGGQGLFLTKINTDGQPIWVKTIPGRGDIRDLSVDENDDILITGYNGVHVDGSEDILSFGGITFPTAGQAFVFKYKSSGDFQWAKGTGPFLVRSVASDNEDGAITYGSFSGIIQLDNLTVNPRTNPPPPAKTYNALVARLGYKLKADFKFVSGCPNSETKFQDWSTAESGTALTEWHWEFGDGTTSDLQHPSHTYLSGGQYTVKLTLKDDQARTISKSATVDVPATQLAPEVKLTAPGFACEGSSSDYTAIVTNVGANYDLNWYVDGVLQPDASGKTKFTLVADHDREVKAQVVDPGKQCASSNTAEDSITVPTFATPAKPSISAFATDLCSGSTTTISTTSTAPVLVWSTGESTSQITVNGKGPYSLRVGNNAACLSAPSEPIEIKFHDVPLAPAIVESGNACIGETVTLSAGSKYGVYAWSTGETTSQITIGNDAPDVILRVGEISDCLSAPAHATVTFYQKPAAPALSPAASTICDGTSVEIKPANTYAVYKWNTGASTSSIVATSQGNYSLQVGTSPGCLSDPSAPASITVSSKPLAKITVAGNSLTSSAGASYKWYKDNQLMTFTGQQLSVEASGVYKVEVFSSLGCSSMSDGVSMTITGLEEATNSIVTVSPNPVRDRLYIETSARINSVKLVDILGRTVFTGESKIIEVGSISTGAYLIFIETEFGPVTKRIIKL